MDRRKILEVAAALGLSACSSRSSITVGAKNFIEQDILGAILTQHLTRRLGQTVRQKLHLGGSFLAHQALVDGGIDLYPEYSGTALTACLKLPLTKDVFAAVKTAYSQRHQVEWGWSLGFSNTFAMVMRRSEATQLQIRTLSDAVAKRKDWRMGVGYEFEQRPDGWPAFRQTYPFTATIKTMDLGLIYRALSANSVDIVAGNSTDPALASPDFIALEDDKSFFPPYETCLAVRQDALAREPKLRGALDILTGRINLAVMRKWNAQAVIEHQTPENIAAAFVVTL